MRYSELVRKLRKLGLEPFRQAKGSHEIWWWPEKKRRTSIPRHANREISRKTLKSLLEQLGLKEDDLKGL